MCRVYVSSGHSQFQENCVDPLYQLHSLVDILQDGTDLQTYPENFTVNYVIAYGSTGSVSNIDRLKVKGLFIVEIALSLSGQFTGTPLKYQKQIIQIQHNRIKNPNWQKATSWLFTSVAENLNSGRPSANPASGQSGTRTRDRRIASPTRRPLGHAASKGVRCAQTANCARCCYGPIYYKYQCLEDIGLFCWRHLLPYLSN